MSDATALKGAHRINWLNSYEWLWNEPAKPNTLSIISRCGMKLLIHSQTILFTTFNGCILEVWKWISNFKSHYMMDVITYPCWDQILFMFIKLTLLFTEIFRYQQEDYFTCCKQQRYLLPRHGTFNYLTQISTQQVKKPVAVHQETIFRKRKNKRAWSGCVTLCIFIAVLRRNHPVQFDWKRE